MVKTLGVDRGRLEGREDEEEGAWPWVNNPSLLLVWELVLFTGDAFLCIFTMSLIFPVPQCLHLKRGVLEPGFLLRECSFIHCRNSCFYIHSYQCPNHMFPYFQQQRAHHLSWEIFQDTGNLGRLCVGFQEVKGEAQRRLCSSLSRMEGRLSKRRVGPKGLCDLPKVTHPPS